MSSPTASATTTSMALVPWSQATIVADVVVTERTLVSLGKEIISFQLCDLTPHPANERLFGLDSPEAQSALDASIEQLGILSPLRVAGEGCEQPYGTIISGHRRARAASRLGLEIVPAVVLHDLTNDELLELLVADNLAGTTSRRLSPRQLYAIEETYRELIGRRQGSRSDLNGEARGETNELVAKKVGETTNAVKTRKTIFDSPLVPESLKVAVDAGKLSQAKGAKIARDLQKAHDKGTPSEVCTALAEAAMASRKPLLEVRTNRPPIEAPTSGVLTNLAEEQVYSNVGLKPVAVIAAERESKEDAGQSSRLDDFNPEKSSAELINQYAADVEAALMARDALVMIARAHLPPDMEFPRTQKALDDIKGSKEMGLPPRFWDLLKDLDELFSLLKRLSQNKEDM